MRGETWYDHFVEDRFSLGTGGLPILPYCGLALAGEAGETAEKIKKLYRDNNGERTPEIDNAIKQELGDVLFYLVKLAHELGSSLEEIAQLNRAKLQARDAAGTRRGSGDNR